MAISLDRKGPASGSNVQAGTMGVKLETTPYRPDDLFSRAIIG